MISTRTVLALIGILSALSLSSCSTHTAFTYPMDPIQRVSEIPSDVSIAVMPSNDLRNSTNSSATMWLYLIPGMPYGWLNYDRPEASQMFITINSFEMDVAEDIPKAIAQHMQRAQYADNVFFDYGGMRDNADYVLESDVHIAGYHGKLYTYCLSVFGPMLWFVGLPAGSSETTLSMSLRLVDSEGDIAWEDRFTQSLSVTHGMYYNFGRDMENLARCLQRGIDRTMRMNPAPVE